jgi:hypothetical protein
METFPWIDRYIGTLLDIDVTDIMPGDLTIVESNRRLHPEQSYGFVQALYGFWFEDGRIAVSVPPGAGEQVRAHLRRKPEGKPGKDLFALEAERLDALADAVNGALGQAGLNPIYGTQKAWRFACNGTLLRRWETGPCRRLRETSTPPAEGLSIPTHAFPDGIVYGVIRDGQVVSVAYAHRTGLFENRVADLGVETARGYRRRGYAKTTVSAVTAHVICRGGEGFYGCSINNDASIATARSVGYVPYARVLVLAAEARTDDDTETGNTASS